MRRDLPYQYASIVLDPCSVSQFENDLFEFADETRIRVHDEVAKEYGLRSRLHNSICNLLDADREVVEHAFAKVESQFGFKVDGGYIVDGSAQGDFDFAKAYDAFCKELERIDGLSDRERHPDVLFPEDLDKMDFSGLSCLPDMGEV